MYINAIKSLKQEIGIPTLARSHSKSSYKPKKTNFYVVTIGTEFWGRLTRSDYYDAVFFTDESEAIEVAENLEGSKVIYNYGYPSENVIYENY